MWEPTNMMIAHRFAYNSISPSGSGGLSLSKIKFGRIDGANLPGAIRVRCGTLDLPVSVFPLAGAPTKSLIKKICSWALAIRDCRATSCLRIRDGRFRAAATPATRGRRNHQALLEDMETVS